MGYSISKKRREEKAESIYNIILKDVEKFLGKDTTYTNDLIKVGKVFLGSKFKGVFPSDRIPQLTEKQPYAILNLDNSTQLGSHWIALSRIDDKHSVIYDSFGRQHSHIIPSVKYSGNGKILNTDLDKEQKDIEKNCGSRSLAWLILLDKFGENMALLI